MESGAGKSRRSRQRPEGRKHGGSGKDGRREVEGIVLTIAGLKAEGFYLPLLMIVGRGEGAKTSGLEIALVVDVTPEVIEDPLN